MTLEALALFDRFWDYVRHAEDEIRSNLHKGYSPDMVHDPWDHDFAAAYEAIRPYLAPLEERRMFLVPPGIPSRLPFSAATGHQALMFFLNPPRELFGSAESLDSPEYMQIKSRSMTELRILQQDQAGDQKLDKGGLPPERPDTRDQLSETKIDILAAVDGQPRRGEDIAKRAGYTHNTVRKHLPRLIELGLIKHGKSGYYRD